MKELDGDAVGLRGCAVEFAGPVREGARRDRNPPEGAVRRPREGAERIAAARRRSPRRSFPGLYLLITGTPAFFEGRQGIQLLPPLADRLHTDFSRDPRFDNPRAPQLRLTGFDLDRLVELGGRVRDLFCAGLDDADRVRHVADDEFLRRFASAVAGGLGGRVGIAPRLFLRKLVDVLDVIELHPDFDPYSDYEIKIAPSELSDAEREVVSADDVELDL